MDLYCPTPNCGEPWDNDSLHELVSDGDYATYAEAASAFRLLGCAAFGSRHNTAAPEEEPRDAAFGLTRSEAAGALYDLLGDDMDGAASELADLGW